MAKCIIGQHDEELFRKRQDHRYLIWVCKHCDRVTRQMKMNHEQMRVFREVKRVH
jgi:hypothetical protein